jgi:hypothetical protein
MIIDDLTKKMAETIIAEMDAMKDTKEGFIPDHKTRLTAIKEARTLLQSLLPRMSTDDKSTLATTVSQVLEEKIKLSLMDESRLRE